MRTFWPVVIAVLTAAAARSPPQGWSDPRSGELLQLHRNGARLGPFDATMPSYIDMVVQRIKGNKTEVGKDPKCSTGVAVVTVWAARKDRERQSPFEQHHRQKRKTCQVTLQRQALGVVA